MEGRTAVRPNVLAVSFEFGPELLLQWRAGQLSGQTAHCAGVRGRARGPSMEGRTAVRPNRIAAEGVRGCWHPSMEGRTAVRPNLTTERSWGMPSVSLQWRAGQLSGQTSGRPRRLRPGSLPSMEGRTAVRPNQPVRRCRLPTLHAFNGGPDSCPAKRQGPGSRSRRVVLAFNGGPDSCPAKPFPDHDDPATRHCPSMEGRTAVRPNDVRRHRHPHSRDTFNGGPDSCPAKHLLRADQGGSPRPSMEGRTAVRPNWPVCRDCQFGPATLQWRAGQLSGQTWIADRFDLHDGVPSMEGRTAVRPNSSVRMLAMGCIHPSMEGRTAVRPNTSAGTLASPPPPPPSMEGRTAVRPNQPMSLERMTGAQALQWRAGQLSGQTRFPARGISQEVGLQWRAGQLSGQTMSVKAAPVTRLAPSMEGRTAVRPNDDQHPRPRPRLPPSMEGRTAVRPNPETTHKSVRWHPSFNGGPDSCPAKLGRSSGSDVEHVPSMEGRTAVRPNEFSRGVGEPRNS